MRGVNSGNTNSAQMATVTAVTFIVTFAPVLCGLGQKETDTKIGDCSVAQVGAQNVDVSKPNTTITLKCNAEDEGHVTPAFNAKDFKVCIDESCSDPPLLSTYIKGATAETSNGVTATIKITDLPPTAKTFYVQCGDKGKSTCYIVVKVAKDPNAPGGVTTGGPQSCATPGKAITIKIPGKGSTAQFTCGSLTLYPVATDRVFAEDCKKEESLKDVVRSAEVGNVYTLTADKKPPKKKWCYLCAKSSVTSNEPGQASDYCLVHVESSSRTQSSSAIALAAVLPCVLAMLRIT